MEAEERVNRLCLPWGWASWHSFATELREAWKHPTFSTVTQWCLPLKREKKEKRNEEERGIIEMGEESWHLQSLSDFSYLASSKSNCTNVIFLYEHVPVAKILSFWIASLLHVPSFLPCQRNVYKLDLCLLFLVSQSQRNLGIEDGLSGEWDLLANWEMKGATHICQVTNPPLLLSKDRKSS